MNRIIQLIGMSFVVLFAGFSAVDIGEANDLIYACKHKNEGMLRMVDNHTECRTSEIPVSWSIGVPQVECPCWTAETVDNIIGREFEEATCIDNGESGSNTLTYITLGNPGGPDTWHGEIYYRDANYNFTCLKWDIVDQKIERYDGLMPVEAYACRQLLVSSTLWELNCL